MSRYCLACGARLSRYNPEPYCAPCDDARTTYEDYLADETSRKREKAGYCKRGHDQETNAEYYSKGNRSGYRCRACHRQRQREYQKRRRARLSAVRNGATTKPATSSGESSRVAYQSQTLLIVEQQQHGTPTREIARRLGTTEGAIRARLHRARQRGVVR